MSELNSTSVSAESASVTRSGEESYLSLFWIFLKIGSTAFGGFMALISVVENYIVERRKLLSHDEMLDGVSLATILPGPVAVNVVAYVGYKIRGLRGALISSFAVILPSFLLLLGFSYAYFTWGEVPAVNSIFSGFLPAVAAIIVVTAINMGRKALTGPIDISFALIAMLALIFIGGFYSTVIIIVLSGLLGRLVFYKADTDTAAADADTAARQENKAFIPASLVVVTLTSISLVGISILKSNAFILAKLFSTFSTMSLLLFGGGFVFIPLIQETVVAGYGWVSQKEFIDAIALGQVTPGPILISATFIGYKVAGVMGAIIATIAIFMPPAIVMIICTNFLEKLKSSAAIKATLKGIRCSVIGLIAAAAYVVIMSAEPNLVTLIIFVSSMSALLLFKLEVAWIIPAAGALGYFLY